MSRYLRYRAERAVRREALRRMERLGWMSRRSRTRLEILGFPLLLLAALSAVLLTVWLDTTLAYDVVHALGLAS